MIELNKKQVNQLRYLLWDQVSIQLIDQLNIQVFQVFNPVWNQINRVHNTILDHIEDPR